MFIVPVIQALYKAVITCCFPSSPLLPSLTGCVLFTV